MAALTLYHSALSLCAAKVRIVLAEKQIDWASVLLNLRAGDSRKPEYLQLNPNALVPTIVQDQRPLIESTVICEYLDDRWPDPSLKPGHAWDRARMRLWTKQLDEGVHAAVSTLSFCLAIRHEFLAHPPSEKVKWLSGIPQADRRDRSRSNLEEGVNSPFFAPAVWRCIELFADFEQALSKTPWLAGEEFSLADASFAPYLIRLRMLGFSSIFGRHLRVADWADRVSHRPSVKEGVLRWISEAVTVLYERSRPDCERALTQIVAA